MCVLFGMSAAAKRRLHVCMLLSVCLFFIFNFICACVHVCVCMYVCCTFVHASLNDLTTNQIDVKIDRYQRDSYCNLVGLYNGTGSFATNKSITSTERLENTATHHYFRPKSRYKFGNYDMASIYLRFVLQRILHSTAYWKYKYIYIEFISRSRTKAKKFRHAHTTIFNYFCNLFYMTFYTYSNINTFGY